MAQELLRLGAEPNGGEMTMLQCAVRYLPWPDPSTSFLEWVIDELGADVNAIVSDDEGSILCYAARRAYVESVRVLLDRGADPHMVVNHDQRTHPLACALQNRNGWERAMIILEAIRAGGGELSYHSRSQDEEEHREATGHRSAGQGHEMIVRPLLMLAVASWLQDARTRQLLEPGTGTGELMGRDRLSHRLRGNWGGSAVRGASGRTRSRTKRPRRTLPRILAKRNSPTSVGHVSDQNAARLHEEP